MAGTNKVQPSVHSTAKYLVNGNSPRFRFSSRATRAFNPSGMHSAARGAPALAQATSGQFVFLMFLEPDTFFGKNQNETRDQRNIMRINALVLLAAFLALTQTLRAQGTAFTYQGLLSENGARVNGTNDLQFTVHSTANGNNPVSSTITVDDLAVSNGLFTVTLDFGAGVWLANGAFVD